MAKEVIKKAALLGGAMALRAGMTANSVVLGNHRRYSHGAVELAKPIQTVFDSEQRTSGTNAKEWADAHRNSHHQFPDADLYPFRQAYRAILYCQERGIPVPETYHGYDRLVSSFTLEEVMKIGQMGDEYLQEKMGDTMPVKEEYTDQELIDTLQNKDPKYYYDKALFDSSHVYTDDDAAHALLRDQHSPHLAPPNEDGTWNGVRFVAKYNIPLSAARTRLDRQRPELMSPDLRPDSLEPRKGNAPYVWGGFAMAGTAALMLSRDFTPSGVTKAAIKGAAINGGGLGFLAVGSTIVNALGHMGPMTPATLKQALLSKDFQYTCYPNGKLSSDTSKGGFGGRAASAITFDESGRQDGHHRDPGAIAYPDEEGNAGFAVAPYGRFIEKLADSPRVPFIKRGNGVPTRAIDGKRVDDTHPAVLIIEAARAREQYPELYPNAA